MIKKKITYRPYPLKKTIMVNGWEFKKVIISSHFEEKHLYMTDELILKVTKQLDKRVYIPKLQGNLPDSQQE